MHPARRALERLLDGHDLAETEAADLLGQLTQPELPPAMAGALLAALRGKGVTPAEVRGFAGAMRALARKPALPNAPDAIDIVRHRRRCVGKPKSVDRCGVAHRGVRAAVVKHGNRSISSAAAART